MPSFLHIPAAYNDASPTGFTRENRAMPALTTGFMPTPCSPTRRVPGYKMIPATNPAAAGERGQALFLDVQDPAKSQVREASGQSRNYDWDILIIPMSVIVD